MTQERKHTPWTRGKWMHDGYGVVFAPDGRPVAYVSASRMDAQDVTTSDGEANSIATLIAAAPAFAEVAAEILRPIASELASDDYRDNDAIEVSVRDLRRLQAALTKARGDQS